MLLFKQFSEIEINSSFRMIIINSPLLFVARCCLPLIARVLQRREKKLVIKFPSFYI
jgi:hypothetical protein